MCLSTEVDVRMGKVSSVNLVSANQGLTYQTRFEAIRGKRAAQWLKWFGQNVPLGALKVV